MYQISTPSLRQIIFALSYEHLASLIKIVEFVQQKIKAMLGNCAEHGFCAFEILFLFFRELGDDDGDEHDDAAAKLA